MSKAKKQTRPVMTREGVWGRFAYFFARALANLRQNVFVSAVTVATITLALLIAALFLLVYANFEGAAARWSDKVQIVAYFDQEPVPLAVAALKSRVRAIPGTSKVVYVSKEEAEKRFRSRLKGQEALLEGITPEVLPASLEVSLDRAHRETDAIERYVAQLKKVGGIGEVQYGEEWVKKFNSFMNVLRLVGALLGSFLTIAVLFIISNTIKLTVYARKEEVELLGLVGATRFFIKAPFLIEGVLQGALGALLSLILLFACYLAFLENAGSVLGLGSGVSGLSFLPASYIAGVLAAGVLLGFIGSATSLRRFIQI